MTVIATKKDGGFWKETIIKNKPGFGYVPFRAKKGYAYFLSSYDNEQNIVEALMPPDKKIKKLKQEVGVWCELHIAQNYLNYDDLDDLAEENLRPKRISQKEVNSFFKKFD